MGTVAFAQDLPQLSPRSTVKQRIGLTDFEIDYSRPSVRERKVFGELLAFDELWRTGANNRTTFTVNHDIEIGGKDLKAGTYGLLTIPGKETWTIIFSNNAEGWGEGDYAETEDALRLEAEVQYNNHVTETLLLGFDHLDAESGHFIIAFEKAEIHIPIKVNAMEMAWENIEKAIKETPEDARVLRNAAGYAVKTEKNLDKAEKWIEKSIEIKDSWYTHWVKAQVLHANGKTKEAKKSGKLAIEMGQKENGEDFKYAKVLEDEMKEWK